MLSYIVRRLAVAIPTLLILVVFSFVLMFAAPGGPFNSERPLPPQIMPNIEARYGLDQPYWKQMVDYVVNVVTRFDFGPSFQYRDRSVNDIIAQGFPVTLTYGLWSVAGGGGRRRRRWASSRRSGTTAGPTTPPSASRSGRRRCRTS